MVARVDGFAQQARDAWILPDDRALLTDLYQLTMLQAYHAEGMEDEAVFSLFFRNLPESRNFCLAAGLDDALAYLEGLRFTPDALDFLADTPEPGTFREPFLRWLEGFRFEGAVRAMPEGTPVFPDEPLLEVAASLPQAQLAETFLLNQIHFQTVVASKAARVVGAARGRAVVDFGLRRMHGADAGMKAARAGWIAGVAATSNVLAGQVYGIPLAGTMAHSYVQAHDDEEAAFRAFAELYPGTTLLVDTYDTLDGVRRVVELARRAQAADRPVSIRAVRLDSGDLAALARGARKILDEGGLGEVEIFASGGLDEHSVARLAADDVPIDGFGVGTRLGTSSDAPTLDMVYKLVAYGGEGRMKLSTGKRTLPGEKQVFRREVGGTARGDRIARLDEPAGKGERPLLEPVMAGGERLPAGSRSLGEARERARREIARLPETLRYLEPPERPYPVEVSAALETAGATVARAVASQETGR